MNCVILCSSSNLLPRDITKEAKLMAKEVVMELFTTMREASTVETGRTIRCTAKEHFTMLMAG